MGISLNRLVSIPLGVIIALLKGQPSSNCRDLASSKGRLPNLQNNRPL